MLEREYVLGVDIGGTKMEAALLRFHQDSTFDLIARERVKTQRELGREHILKSLASLCSSVASKANGGLMRLSGIGIALPGTVDPKTHLMVSGNTQALVGVDLKSELQKRLGISARVMVANDGNCFTLAETLLGVGPLEARRLGVSVSSLMGMGLVLGTGVGGGLVMNGKIMEGRNGTFCEVGHMIFKQQKRRCYCGGEAHAELTLSGTGIEINFLEATSVKLTSKDIFASAVDPKAPHHGKCQRFVAGFQNDLAGFMANLANLYDPDFFVLGGGVSLQESLYSGLESKMHGLCFNPKAKPKVFKNVLGDSAGVIGAALLV